VTSATAGSSGLADRYASALFEIADTAGALDAVAAELKQLEAMVVESRELSRLIASPVISRQTQWRAVSAVLQAAGTSDLLRRFVGVVADNRRLATLPQIIAAFQRKLAERRGETSVEVISAQPLSPTQLAALTSALQKSVSKNIALTTRTEAALLGGMIVKVGSRMVDSSLSTKLNRLSLAIRGVA
jgi:F-type H+-transporting ATPase subunit delta